MGLSLTYTMRKSFINVKAPIQLKSAFSVSDAGWLMQDRKIRGDFCALARKGSKHVIFILENAMTIYFFVGMGLGGGAWKTLLPATGRGSEV